MISTHPKPQTFYCRTQPLMVFQRPTTLVRTPERNIANRLRVVQGDDRKQRHGQEQEQEQEANAGANNTYQVHSGFIGKQPPMSQVVKCTGTQADCPAQAEDICNTTPGCTAFGAFAIISSGRHTQRVLASFVPTLV